jgi:hypothetical protein
MAAHSVDGEAVEVEVAVLTPADDPVALCAGGVTALRVAVAEPQPASRLRAVTMASRSELLPRCGAVRPLGAALTV